MGFSRHGYWRGLPFLSPGDLPNPGTEPGSSALQADSLPAELPRKSCMSWYAFDIEQPSQTGEGNGNPLQYSCLKNPVDGGAW